MGIGTFGSFTQARLAIYAAQTGITVTGNNISNINTEGYTRQRLNQVSLYTAGADRYYSAGDIRTGQGALVKSLSQIRSPYLDIRYRTLNAQTGYADGKLEVLGEIRQILDEVGAGDASKGENGFGILGLEIEKLVEAFENLEDQTGHQEYDNTVRQVSKNLVTLLNKYANKLEEVQKNTVDKLEQDVQEVNNYLTTIRSLNEEIRKSEIHGDPALELRDERNLQIDKLSELIDIKVIYTEEEISAGLKVEKLNIYLDDANPDSQVFTDESLLVAGVYSAQIRLNKLPVENPAAALDAKNQDTWPYLKDDGNGGFTPTKSLDLAVKVPVENPNWKEGDDPATRYLKADGTPCGVADAAKVKNPVWNAGDDPNEEYLDATGNPCAEADAALQENPNWDPGDGPGKQYLDANGRPTDLAHAAEEPMANPNYKPYLDENGDPTADLAKAQKVTDPNYGMTITKLKNKIGEVYVAIDKGTKVPVKGTDPALDAEGNPVVDKDGHELSIEELFPKGVNSYAVETEDLPSAGDKSLMIYKRVKLANGKFAYTQQLVTQELSKPVTLDDNDLTGKIQAWREMLTEKGEFTDRDVIANVDENAGGKRGIPYYQRTLDLLANQFAKVMNEANQGFLQDPNGNFIAADPKDPEVAVAVTIPVNGKDEPINSDWGKNSEDVQNEIIAGVKGLTAQIMKDEKLTGKDVLDAYMKGQSWDAGEKKFIPENQEDILDKDGNVVTEGWGGEAKPTARGIFKGGVLFSNNPGNDDPSGITASNISISYTWDTKHILVCDYKCPPGLTTPASGASDNILHFEYLLSEQKHDFIPTELDGYENASGKPMLNGTFSEMWNNIGTTRGEDEKYEDTMLNANYKNLLSVDTERDSVSSVDFNDEAMNLMMYSKSYNAACRLMTTIDSVLDKLINNTGITT